LKYFKDLGLAEPVLRAVTATGYTTPTPIQIDVIPAMTAQKDVIGIAQTGTGKTASFVLPILNRIAAGKNSQQKFTCGTLILTPTRELASQIADAIKTYGKYMTVSTVVIVGGVKPGPQIKACSNGVDIIIATPGRLLDLMSSGAIRLDQTYQVIADEADQMMDMGFLPSIRKIMQSLPTKRQTVLMSATMPTQIRKLAKEFMHNPTEVSVASAAKPIELITQVVERVEKEHKKQVLTDILANNKITRAVVFVRTKHGANKITTHLTKAGLDALAIHGNKSQGQRDKTIASFKAGKTRILVATDIAARGIDISDVSHVINFELPNVAETYVHRIGRTARAGRSGVAISLCDSSELKLLRDIEKLTGQNLSVTMQDNERLDQRETSERRQKNSSPKTRNDRPQNAQSKPDRVKTSRKFKRHRNQARKIDVDKPDQGLMRMLGKNNNNSVSP